MCGIAGIYKYDNCKVKKSEIIGMLSKIKHRGPDGQNIFIYNNVGLGHVLLKIQDTTNNSLQPYFFKNLVLIYNGEIYNYVDLRKELILKNYDFITDGDTEVLIKLIDCYGLKKALSKINGCFAFSLYNKKTKHMYLVRDRFGIKPLYYYFDKKRIIFCSEIKGILQCKNIPKKFNIDKVLETFNCRLWLDQKSTLFKKIYCLMPGTYIEISNNRQIFKNIIILSLIINMIMLMI
jgi:asparagine synthase (glutamine-hydrolysing)